MGANGEYPAPEQAGEPREVKGIKSGEHHDLYKVALAQKAIIYCILAYLAGVALALGLPEGFELVAGLMILGASLTGIVFVFILAVRVYGIEVGILLGFLTLVPCVGLVVLLVVSTKASSILQQKGFRVSLLGADLGEVKRRFGPPHGA